MSTTSTLDTSTALSAESALAARTLRLAKGDLNGWSWLSNARQPVKEGSPKPCPVGESIDELIEPLMEGANEWSVRRAKPTSQVLPRLLVDIKYSVRSLEETVRNRLTAMVLLPIYRGLGTAELDDGFDEMRRRCLEAHVLLKLVCLLGDDLSDRINKAQQTDLSPYCILRRDLEIDLTRVSDIVARTVGGYDSDSDDFDSNARQVYGDPGTSKSVPDWARPDLLWRLAGQLDSSAANLTLPRPWVETPIPWQSVDRHWKELSKRLDISSGSPDHSVATISQDDDSSSETPSASKHCDEQHEPLEQKMETPRVMIAEVLSHNDPAYVNHLAKRISLCYQSKRPVLTVAIQLRGEEDSKARKRAAAWEQRLLVSLQESEDVGEAFAFMTTDGRLLINLLDIDRMDATELIRDTLQDSLQPRSDFGAEANSTPIFFAGMAACTTPSPSLKAVDLIEAAIRCLDAAQLQKRSAIKSIEVY